MSIVKVINQLKTIRLLAVDPASHSLAWSVVDLEWNKFSVVATGKIDFKSQKEVSNKFSAIRQGLKEVCEEHKPTHAAIEQSVYIQNFQSSRILSYIIGYSWGVLDDYCGDVCDINPLIWKNKIGYKNVSKDDKKEIEKKHGTKGLQKRLTEERKTRVKRIIEAQVGCSTDDDDINDSLGIALWYYVDRGYGTIQG